MKQQYFLPAYWCAAAIHSGKYDFSSLRNASAHAAAQLCQRLFPQHQHGLWSPFPYLRIHDEDYPPILAQQPYAPPVLFLQGNAQLLQTPIIGIVGSRYCTGRGKVLAWEYSRTLLTHGYTTISGLAYGIDTIVHQGSLPHTIGVLAQGLGAPRSRHLHELCQQILKANGLLISEFLPHYSPKKWTYLQRNRIIAWLAQQLILVEAPQRSGALNTVRHALHAGRDVWVVPWSPTCEAGAGCLALIEDGAPILKEANDLLGKVIVPTSST